MTFDTLGLKPTLLQAVIDSGYTTPTPIQSQAIPAVLSGRDIMAAAQTGTGKTAGFTLPLLQLLSDKEPVKSNHVRALILTPTRELAAQIQESIQTYGKHEKVRSVVVFGGVNINPQLMALRKGSDILVATPGRLLDLFQQNAVKFSELEILILDEADRMLDMGFIRDIRKILNLLPKKRQNLMFSATFSPEIRELAKTICHQAVEIDVAPRNSTVETISQQIYMVSKDRKLALLGKLLTETADQVLVFSRTKHGANNLVKKLSGYQVNAAAIHGNKSQAQRTKALADFKANRVQVLVATDIAARGIDIDQLAMVINYDLPQVSEDYIHRIGRTGRAGASGLAVSLVTEEDGKLLRDIERLIKLKIQRANFDPATLPQPKIVVEVVEERPRQSRNGQGQRRSAPRGQGRSATGASASPSQQGRTASTQGGAPSNQGRGRSAPRTNTSAPRLDSTGEVNGNRLDVDNSNRMDLAYPRGTQPGRGNGGARHQQHGAAAGQQRTHKNRGRNAGQARTEQQPGPTERNKQAGAGFWSSLKQGIGGVKVFGK